jgi:uncharacterized membrane protein
MKNKKVLFLTQFSILLAIEALVCFTPLGSLPVGPLVATLSHIPVIVTAITMGAAAGSLMGFFFGLFSFIVWTFMTPSPLVAFVFTPVYPPGNIWSLVICFAPRILIGAVTGWLFSAMHKSYLKHHEDDKKEFFSYFFSAMLGSLTNTVLVLMGIYFFFGEAYAEAFGMAFEALLAAIGTFIATNGALECALAIIIAYAVCKPVRRHVLKLK